MKKGEVVAYDQIVLEDKTGNVPDSISEKNKAKYGKVTWREDGDGIEIGAGNVSYRIEKGQICSIKAEGRELLLSPMEINLSRALTDNDIDTAHFVPMLLNSMTGKKWEASQGKLKFGKLEKEDAENGTRCDVKELCLSEGEQERIQIESLEEKDMLFSAWHYSKDNLNKATHSHLLAEEALTTVNIDGAMCGVGGDLPGMLSLHEKYQLKPKQTHRMDIRMRFQ